MPLDEAQLLKNRNYKRTLKGLFSGFKSDAKSRGIKAFLTFEQFVILRSQSCFYCGGELPKAGHGVDRIDSKVAYVYGNCRSCCVACNVSKSDKSEQDFMSWILRVYNHSLRRLTLEQTS
jgi:hypothetical protein